MKKVNVLFLDIDGVLNSPKWMVLLHYEGEVKRRSTRGQEFDPTNVRMLNHIVNEFDVHVVVSSTWRNLTDIKTILQVGGVHAHFFDAQNLTRDPEDKEWRPEPGFDHESYQDYHQRMGTITTTKLTGIGGHRGRQIEDWFSKFGHFVDKWAILDDDSDMLPEQMPNFVKTDSENGMTLENFRQLRRIYLGDKEE